MVNIFSTHAFTFRNVWIFPPPFNKYKWKGSFSGRTLNCPCPPKKREEKGNSCWHFDKPAGSWVVCSKNVSPTFSSTRTWWNFSWRDTTMKTNITSRRRSSQILCLFEPSRGNCMILPHQVGMNLHTNGKEKTVSFILYHPQTLVEKNLHKNLDVCVCVYTYMIMFISLYLYISISLLISIIYLYLYLHLLFTLIFISIPTFISTFTYTSFPPVCFPKSRVAASVFFLTPPGLRLQLLLPFDLLLPSIGRRPLPNLTALAVLTPQKRTHLNQPTNPQEISGKHTFAVSFLGGFFPPWKIPSMGFVRFLVKGAVGSM